MNTAPAALTAPLVTRPYTVGGFQTACTDRCRLSQHAWHAAMNGPKMPTERPLVANVIDHYNVT